MLGEVEFSLNKSSITSLLGEVVRDLSYYLSLRSEPEKDWDYDFGFGAAYAAGGSGLRKAELFTDLGDERRFVVACFDPYAGDASDAYEVEVLN